MSSGTGNGGSDQALLTPNAGTATAKPVRKRSRPSQKTPATLLNASPANFRALVQQFTGFQAASSSVSLQRDPVYLSFAGDKQGLLETASGAANSSRNQHRYLHPQISGPQQQRHEKNLPHGNRVLLGSANNVEVEDDGSLLMNYHGYYSINKLSLDSFLI